MLRILVPSAALRRPLRPTLANMDTNTSVDLVVARLCQGGAEIRSLAGAPWIDDLEARLGLSFPPSFRSLVNRYAFPLLDIGRWNSLQMKAMVLSTT